MHANRSFVSDVITISPEEDLVAAAKLMREKHVGFLIVAGERNGDQYPIGVLSDRDIMIECVAADVNPHNVKVSDIMVSRPLVTNTEEDLETLLSRMRVAGVRRAPVVDDAGALIGVVSFDDLLQTLAGMLNDMADAAFEQRSTETRVRA